jgi:hypothetical protein
MRSAAEAAAERTSRAGRTKLRPVAGPSPPDSGEGRWLARLGETFAESHAIPLPGPSSLRRPSGSGTIPACATLPS